MVSVCWHDSFTLSNAFSELNYSDSYIFYYIEIGALRAQCPTAEFLLPGYICRWEGGAHDIGK